MSDYRDRILAFLTRAGAEKVAITRGGKHPRILFEWRGEPLIYVIAGTSGDTLAGHRAAIRDLRHMMGIVPPIKRIGKRRARKNHSALSMKSQCPMLTAIPDWRSEILAALTPEQLNAQADLAWLRFWQSCLEAVGGKSVLAA